MTERRAADQNACRLQAVILRVLGGPLVLLGLFEAFGGFARKDKPQGTEADDGRKDGVPAHVILTHRGGSTGRREKREGKMGKEAVIGRVASKWRLQCHCPALPAPLLASAAS